MPRPTRRGPDEREVREMKVQLKNKFHGTKAVVSIKDRYCGRDQVDALAALDLEVYAAREDAVYARRKLKEIKAKLCGVTDCRCTIDIDE